MSPQLHNDVKCHVPLNYRRTDIDGNIDMDDDGEKRQHEDDGVCVHMKCAQDTVGRIHSLTKGPSTGL